MDSSPNVCVIPRSILFVSSPSFTSSIAGITSNDTLSCAAFCILARLIGSITASLNSLASSPRINSLIARVFIQLFKKICFRFCSRLFLTKFNSTIAFSAESFCLKFPSIKSETTILLASTKLTKSCAVVSRTCPTSLAILSLFISFH